MTNDKQTLDLKSSNQFYLDLLDRRAANKDNPKLKLPWPGFNQLMPELGYGKIIDNNHINTMSLMKFNGLSNNTICGVYVYRSPLSIIAKLPSSPTLHLTT